MAHVIGFSRGRVALLKVLQRTRVEFVAARCRVSEKAVYKWTAGRRTPAARTRRLLEENYRIRAEWWDEEAAV